MQPRLAGFAATGSALVYDGGSFPVAPDRSYLAVTSVDFDRDGRPTAVLGYTDTNGNARLEVFKLDNGSSRSIVTLAAHLSWGDLDHDAFPDGLATTTSPGSATYRLLSNVEAMDRARTIGPPVDSAMVGGVTTGSPAVRGFEWIDANRDHMLDAIAYGSELNVHLGQRLGLSDTPQIRVDCNPPALVTTCNGSGGSMNTQTLQSFAGAVVPEAAGTALVIAEFPAGSTSPTVHRVEVTGSALDLAQAPTYTFPPCVAGTCPPILAVIARDLDGDHQLDIIAIDSELQVYTALGGQLQLTRAIKLPTALPTVFDVRTSVTGVPR
jgi:hypothetical protein